MKADEITATAKRYALTINSCGIGPGRRLLFTDGDDLTHSRLVEVEDGALVGLFRLSFITDGGSYILTDFDPVSMTPRSWGRLRNGWWIYPGKVSIASVRATAPGLALP